MEYVYYNKAIITKYGMDLIGWTHLTFGCPSHLSSSISPLQTLFNALENERYKLMKLTTDEKTAKLAEYQHKIQEGQMQLKK